MSGNSEREKGDMREKKAPKATAHRRVKTFYCLMFLKRKAQTDHETKSRKRSVSWQAQSAKEQCKEKFFFSFFFFFFFLLFFFYFTLQQTNNTPIRVGTCMNCIQALVLPRPE